MIYFDNAATTYPKPCIVMNALNTALDTYSFNAGRGGYDEAERCTTMIDETRGKIVSLLKANLNKDSVVFSSTITEALNNVIYGLSLPEGSDVYVSPFEHNAVLRTLHNLKVNVRIIPFDDKTYDVDYIKLKSLFVMYPPSLVVLSQISNVVGFHLPYSKVFELAKKFKTVCILDAAQGFGIYDVDTSYVDVIAFEGHKSLYSIYGTAGFINLTNVPLNTIKVGGTGSDSLNLSMPNETPYRYEAGTYNSFSIYVLGKATEFITHTDIADINHKNTEYLMDKLTRIQNIIVYFDGQNIPNGIVSFNVNGIESKTVEKFLYEKASVALRSGFHCSAFIHKFLNTEAIGGTVRVSFGAFNTKDEIDTFIDVLKEIKNE